MDDREFHPQLGVAAEAAQSVVVPRGVVFDKFSEDLLHPASLMKLLTMYVARRLAPDVSERVTVMEDDLYLGKKVPALRPGDSLSMEDLFFLSALPSHNGAARILARAAGRSLVVGPPDRSYAEFVDAMGEQTKAWGWDGAVVGCASGLNPDSRLSASWVTQLMLRIYEEDPWLLRVLGTPDRSVAISGRAPQTTLVHHTLKPSGVMNADGFLAGKTGTIRGTYGSVAVLEAEANGEIRCTTVLRSTPEADRYKDLRTIRRYT